MRRVVPGRRTVSMLKIVASSSWKIYKVSVMLWVGLVWLMIGGVMDLI